MEQLSELAMVFKEAITEEDGEKEFNDKVRRDYEPSTSGKKEEAITEEDGEKEFNDKVRRDYEASTSRKKDDQGYTPFVPRFLSTNSQPASRCSTFVLYKECNE